MGSLEDAPPGVAAVGHRVVFGGERFTAPALLDDEVVERARNLGGTIDLVGDPFEAVKGVDAVYTDVWTSMGEEHEAAERRAIFVPYQVNEDLMAAAKREALFMHCLPAHRGEEQVDDRPPGTKHDVHELERPQAAGGHDHEDRATPVSEEEPEPEVEPEPDAPDDPEVEESETDDEPDEEAMLPRPPENSG
mgnify:CR=1 FL=1